MHQSVWHHMRPAVRQLLTCMMKWFAGAQRTCTLHSKSQAAQLAPTWLCAASMARRLLDAPAWNSSSI